MATIPPRHTVTCVFRVNLTPTTPNRVGIGPLDAGILSLDVPVIIGDVQDFNSLSFKIDRDGLRESLVAGLITAAEALRTAPQVAEGGNDA